MGVFTTTGSLFGPTGLPRVISLHISGSGPQGSGGGTVVSALVAAPVDAPEIATPEASNYTDVAVPHLSPAPSALAAGPAIARATPPRVDLAAVQPYVDPAVVESLDAFRARYEQCDNLGEGGEGHAILVKHRQTGQLAVAKYSMVSSDADKRGREALSLPRINSPHVVGFHGVYRGPNPDVRGQDTLWVVTDYVEGHSLAQLLRMPASKRPIQFTEDNLWEILRQLQAAVTANEHATVVHGDLHPGNVIITARDDGTFHVTAIDYGVSKVIDYKTIIHVSRRAGRPLFHTPPELMSSDTDTEFSFVLGTDRHYVGTVLLELMVGREVAAHMAPQDLLLHLRQQVPSPWSRELLDAIAGLIREKPAERMWPTRTVAPVEKDAASATAVPISTDVPAAIAIHSAVAVAAAPRNPHLLTSAEALQRYVDIKRIDRVVNLTKVVPQNAAEALFATFFGVMGTIETTSTLGYIASGIALVAGVVVGAVWHARRRELRQLSDPLDPITHSESIYYDASSAMQYSPNPPQEVRVYSLDTLADTHGLHGSIHWFLNGLTVESISPLSHSTIESPIGPASETDEFSCVGRLPGETHTREFIFRLPRRSHREATQNQAFYTQLLYATQTHAPLLLHIDARRTAHQNPAQNAFIVQNVIHVAPAMTRD